MYNIRSCSWEKQHISKYRPSKTLDVSNIDSEIGMPSHIVALLHLMNILILKMRIHPLAAEQLYAHSDIIVKALPF